VVVYQTYLLGLCDSNSEDYWMISQSKTILASRISTASPCIQRRIHVGQRRQVICNSCNSMSPPMPPATGFTWPQRSVASSGTEAAEPPKRISSLNHRGSRGYVSCLCIFKIHVKLFQGCVWFVTSATSWGFTNGRITNHLSINHQAQPDWKDSDLTQEPLFQTHWQYEYTYYTCMSPGLHCP